MHNCRYTRPYVEMHARATRRSGRAAGLLIDRVRTMLIKHFWSCTVVLSCIIFKLFFSNLFFFEQIRRVFRHSIK
jgi:hypothetical protein